MKRLLKLYSFNSDMQYFERIVLLYQINDIKSAKVMFKDMPLTHRKLFINAALGKWQSTLTNQDISTFVAIL